PCPRPAGRAPDRARLRADDRGDDGAGASVPAGGRAMNLLLVGCSYKTAPIALREKLALDGPKLAAALHELEARYACEAAILSTCNRVELYLARADAGGP